MNLLGVILGIFFVVKCALSARILGVFPIEWGSHYILGTKLMAGLAEAGHNITVITPRKYKNPPLTGSWTDIELTGFAEEFETALGVSNFFQDSKNDANQQLRKYTEYLLLMTNQTFQHPNVKKLINSDATFDAVIIDQIMNDFHHIFAYHYGCPLILFSSIGPNPMINLKVGNPSPVSTIPGFTLDVDDSENLTFVERLKNLGLGVLTYLFIELQILSQHNRLLHEALPNAPDIHELYYNASLVLLNSHTSFTKAVPVVPNMIEIGGYHIDPPQKLPKDLQDFLDSAKDGVIYFSMGSQLKSKDMLEEKRKTLLDVFGKLKQKILWKFEEDLPDKPKNVLIKNWMPQQDILAHPNIKLFITHGGLLSATETIYHGVPVLTIPVFGDQERNAHQVVKMGIGLKIGYNADNFNEETLYNLIQELLNNPKYKENAQDRSKIYHDRPMTPMESAEYWVEYVIRHKGAPHLRVAGVGMSWYKYFMVDVILAFASCVVIFIIIVKYLFKKLVRFLFGKTLKSVKQKKN